jgi:choline dehydrogenase-like flavoprotein
MTNILELPEPNPRMMYYRGESEPDIAGRKMSVAAGSILGGGSSVNMMTYSRGHRGDMNDWGAPGWSADDMVPYLKKVHSTQVPQVAIQLAKESSCHLVRNISWPWNFRHPR